MVWILFMSTYDIIGIWIGDEIFEFVKLKKFARTKFRGFNNFGHVKLMELSFRLLSKFLLIDKY